MKELIPDALVISPCRSVIESADVQNTLDKLVCLNAVVPILLDEWGKSRYVIYFVVPRKKDSSFWPILDFKGVDEHCSSCAFGWKSCAP